MTYYKNKFIKIINTVLIITLVSGCGAFTGNNVKLKDYPAEDLEVKSLSLSYEDKIVVNKEKNKRYYNSFINSMFEEKYNVLNSKKINYDTNCLIEFLPENELREGNICTPYFAVSFFTAFILPYYCNQKYEIKASLISQKDNKVLKEYHLKDRVHELWSFFWLFTLPFDFSEKINSPQSARYKVAEKLAKALTRQVIHDAKQFKECRK